MHNVVVFRTEYPNGNTDYAFSHEHEEVRASELKKIAPAVRANLSYHGLKTIEEMYTAIMFLDKTEHDAPKYLYARERIPLTSEEKEEFWVHFLFSVTLDRIKKL